MNDIQSREDETEYPWGFSASGVHMTWRMTAEGLCMHWTLESVDEQSIISITSENQSASAAA